MISASPERILSTPEVMAKLDEMHAIVTVLAGTLSGMPAPRAASRAMLLVLTS